MSNEPMIFQNPEFGKVRAIELDGEPYFVAADVAIALGYKNISRDIRNHCKYAKLLKSTETVLLAGTKRGMLFIPEADVYALIFGSKLPKAEAFKDWVFTEVLPTIRKTGHYGVQKELTMEDLCRQYIATCEKQRELETTLQAAIAEKQQAIETLTEKTNEIGAGPDYYAVHDIPWYNEMFPRKDKGLNQQLGQLLSYITNQLGLEIKKCHEEKGAHWWRAYPAPAVESLYDALIEDPNMLRRYRKPRRRS